MVTITKEQVAQQLASAHYMFDRGLKAVYRLIGSNEADEDEPVKLLEINEDTVVVGIRPVYFGPHASSGITYPSVIIEIAPEEFGSDLVEELQAKYGWRLGDSFPRPADVAADQNAVSRN